MVDAKEIRDAKTQIDKIEARLAHQRGVVRSLGLDAGPRFAAIANETLVLLERRLAALRSKHVGLVEDYKTRR